MNTVKVAVMGAGISGLATAFRLKKNASNDNIPLAIKIYEAESRSGGKILSQKENEFIMEWGPNGFLDNKPSTLQLCKDLGLDSQLLPANIAAKKRYVYSDSILHALPTNPSQFFQSNLVSMKGKLRLISELAIKKNKSASDETIAQFARRRLGSEAYEKLIDPMVSGVFAGNPENLSLQSCFPRIHELEQTYGGLIKSLLKLSVKRLFDRQKNDRDKRPRSGPAGPGGLLTSFRDGVEVLTTRLAAEFKDNITYNVTLIGLETAIIGDRRRYSLLFNGPERSKEYADVVILALPAYEMKRIFDNLHSPAKKSWADIPYVPVAVVGLGFEESQLRKDLDGFGFVVPFREDKNILGTLFTTSIFDYRAPENHVLLRTMVGGARKKDLVSFPSEKLISLTLEVLKPILEIQGKPVFQHVIKHEHAIPQYTQGHRDRIIHVEQECSAFPGLFVTGNSMYGIGMNDCTKESERIACNVITFIKEAYL